MKDALLLFYHSFQVSQGIFLPLLGRIFQRYQGKMREFFSKEETCHIEMISLLHPWLNISKETRKNVGKFFHEKKYVI